MHFHFKKSFLFLCVVAASTIGCTKNTPTAGLSENDRLVYCSEGSPESFNPQRTLSGTARNATATTIYDRLVDFEPGTTKVIPSLAESWSVSEDKKTYIFNLKKGIKFQTTEYFKPTRDFSADDVLFSFNRQLVASHPFHNVGGGNYQYFQGMGMDKLITSIEKLSDYQVKITIKQPESPFLANLAMPFMSILSAEYGDILSKKGGMDSIDTFPIGTGPYSFKSYSKDSMIKYVAHENYWGTKPNVKNLTFAITPDAGVRYQKMKKGECQIMVSPEPTDLESIRQNQKLSVVDQDGMNFGYLAMNTQKPPFNNVSVRKAIAHALNKKSYIDAIYAGNATVAINPYPSTMWSYTDQVEVYDYDLAKAKELLTKAGYPDGFSTTLWTLPVSRPYNPNGKKMGEMMQADLAKIGIKVKLVTYDWGTYLDKVKSGEHDMVQLGWSGDNGDPDNFLYTLFSCDSVTRGSNNARYCNPEFNSLISKAREMDNVTDRERLYKSALLKLSQDTPVIPIAHSKVFRVINKEVSGYIKNPFDIDYFSTIKLVHN